MESKVMKDLQAAFGGESQANRKYLAYALQAEKDGYPGVAKMFRAISAAETIHAHSHLQLMGKVNDTAANLKDALEGETYEFSVMYPQFIEDAKAEGDKRAEKTFVYANEAEKVHGELYKKTLESLESWQGQDADWYLCPICGFVQRDSAPDHCPICGAKASVFRKNPEN